MRDPTNAQIAAAFEELADLYELDGVSQYRVFAYRAAAKAARDAAVSVAAMTREGRAQELPGIGKTLEEKLLALIETGDIPAAQKLREKYPSGLVAITHLPGFGPKRARRLFDELGVDSLESLRAACEQRRIRRVRGFGPKVEEALLEALTNGEDGTPAPRILLNRALTIGEQLKGALEAHPAAERVEIAGSARRLTDSVKDLDLVATAKDPRALVEAFTAHPLVEQVLSSGQNAARASTHSGMRVDLKVVEPDQFGNVLQHLTGSKAHNVALREAAVRRGLHVSEYGILDDATGATHRCATEEEVYERLGLPWIPPELREDRGELDGRPLPELITMDDIRGDLHCHTTLSDGRHSLEQMVEAAIGRGYEYLCVTDHSATHGFGNAVSPEQLSARIEEVRALRPQLPAHFTLLVGTETNILPDGSPDYDDELLAELDWVVGSIHTSFSLDRQAMTDRMVRAVEHPWIDAIGHPTGRKIETREPYALDMERVIAAAARSGTMLEINAAPDRRDLNDVHARAAADAGVWIVIDSDAHATRNFALLEWGVATARRAWLTRDQVANTRPWADMEPLTKHGRARAGRRNA